MITASSNTDQEGSASFLKKRSKKLSVLRALATAASTPARAKVFLLLFFQKKKRLLCLLKTPTTR
jgi:hypothetical protein